MYLLREKNGDFMKRFAACASAAVAVGKIIILHKGPFIALHVITVFGEGNAVRKSCITDKCNNIGAPSLITSVVGRSISKLYRCGWYFCNGT